MQKSRTSPRLTSSKHSQIVRKTNHHHSSHTSVKKRYSHAAKRSQTMASSFPQSPSSNPLLNSSSEVFQNTFLFFDLDGTLLPSGAATLSTATRHMPQKQLIPVQTSSAIHKMGQHRAKRVLITGRNYTSTISILKNSYKELYGDAYCPVEQEKMFQAKREQSPNSELISDDHGRRFALFDYVITSSGAAISDHTFQIIEKKSIPMDVMTKCVDFFHAQQYSYFLQHPIPINHVHHWFDFSKAGNSQTNGVETGDKLSTLDEYQALVNGYLHVSKCGQDQQEQEQEQEQQAIILPGDFCVSFYNKLLPTDFAHRVEFHTKDENSFELAFGNEIDHTTSTSLGQLKSRYSALKQALEDQIGHDSISQSIIPLHRNTFIPLQNLNDLEAIFPRPHEARRISTRVQLQSQCPCCAGSYMLYENPQELMAHLGFNMFRYLNQQQLAESGQLFNFHNALTPIHCTSPFDHQTIWFELSPSNVNKDLAAEQIINRFYSLDRSSPSPIVNEEHGESTTIQQLSITTTNQSTNPISSPLGLFSFGNDYNDLPMLSFIKNYSPSTPQSHIASPTQPLLKGSYMIHTTNPTLTALCQSNGFEIIGTCEDGAVGVKLEELLEQIVNLRKDE